MQPVETGSEMDDSNKPEERPLPPGNLKAAREKNAQAKSMLAYVCQNGFSGFLDLEAEDQKNILRSVLSDVLSVNDHLNP